MTNSIITKYSPVTATGNIFAEEVTTKYVELNNYKYLDFLLISSGGIATEVLVTALAKQGEDCEPMPIEFRLKNIETAELRNASIEGCTVTIGDTDALKSNILAFRILADNLAKIGADRVALKVDKADGNTISGSILAVSYEPRYTE